MGLPSSSLIRTPQAFQIGWFVPRKPSDASRHFRPERQDWGLAAIAHRGTKRASCGRLSGDGQGLDLANFLSLTGLRDGPWYPCSAVYDSLCTLFFSKHLGSYLNLVIASLLIG